MYIVRLRTPSRAASLILTEWVPVAVVLRLVYSANLWVTILMLAGNFALYECGYLFNDLADSTAEPNGDHLEGRRINATVFYGTRILLFSLIVAILSLVRGARFAFTFASLSALMLLAFFWHTSRRPRRLRFLRIFTFAFLYLYKLAPVVFPQVRIREAQLILTAVFFCWGLWRFVFYILGKFGGPQTSRGQDFDPLRLLHPMSLVICAPLLLAGGFSSTASKASCLLWLFYATLAVLRSSFQLSDWRLNPADWQGTDAKVVR